MESVNLLKSVPFAPRYKAFGRNNLDRIPQLRAWSSDKLNDIQVVSAVLPFRVNSYLLDELIDWSDPNDPLLLLTFPNREMLRLVDFEKVEQALKSGDKNNINKVVNEVRFSLNPHPAGQIVENRPNFEEKLVSGLQHKYQRTVLFFPAEGQTCHAYCTFCFRWPQFVGENELRFATKEVEALISYLRLNPQVSDLLITGGDPLIMTSNTLSYYIDKIIAAKISSLTSIRIGTKAFAYWPYRFVTDSDAASLLALFRRVVDSGIHLSVMAHINHVNELKTDIVHKAISLVRSTGAEIRAQSPILRGINDSALSWSRLWSKQVSLGIIPYYMFIARDTGAQDFFAVPLAKATNIFQAAIQSVSGLARTVRGPSMSCFPGKVEILGTESIAGEKVFVLRFLQGRNPSWSYRPFFAKYDPKAIWFDELKPAFGESEFFFQKELVRVLIT
jgi:KamA family protein